MAEFFLNTKKGVAIIILLVVALYPTSSIVAPKWEFRVLLPDKSPAQNAKVTQAWIDTGAQFNWRYEVFYTDNLGKISLPQRTVRTPNIVRIYLRLSKLISLHDSLVKRMTVEIESNGFQRHYPYFQEPLYPDEITLTGK